MAEDVPLLVVSRVASALDTMGVTYVVGGSLASSLHGIPRSTQDADIVAAMGAEHVDRFASLLGTDFYADVDMMKDAVARRASFNLVHRPTMFKVDVFVMRGDSFSRTEMRRGISVLLPTPEGEKTIRFATPEDTLLHKLVWYKLGNEISDRQWGDILGIMKVQTTLDDAYLDEWADALDVAQLLLRARRAVSS